MYQVKRRLGRYPGTGRVAARRRATDGRHRRRAGRARHQPHRAEPLAGHARLFRRRRVVGQGLGDGAHGVDPIVRKQRRVFGDRIGHVQPAHRLSAEDRDAGFRGGLRFGVGRPEGPCRAVAEAGQTARRNDRRRDRRGRPSGTRLRPATAISGRRRRPSTRLLGKAHRTRGTVRFRGPRAICRLPRRARR